MLLPQKENARQIKDVHYIREEKIATWTAMVAAKMAKVCRFKIYFGDAVIEEDTIVSWVHSFLQQILSVHLLTVHF